MDLRAQTSTQSGKKTLRWLKPWLVASAFVSLTPLPVQAIEWNPLNWFGDDEKPITQPQGSTTVIQVQSGTPTPIDQPHAINDLAYGDLLFDYYQEQYFAAITKILVAQQRGQLSGNSEHAQLILGALYVSYGLLDRGEAIFQELLDTWTSTEGADESWYQLARIHYKRGELQQAVMILNSKVHKPLATRPTEQVLLEILCLVQMGQPDQAQQLTRYLQNNQAESIFVRFNIGAALAQLGQLEQAAGYYADVVKQSRNTNNPTETDKTLTDRASLALGIHYLRSNQLELAKETLNSIRLYGPVSNRALLALGWADYRADRKIDALHPWLELSERPLTDLSAQESLLNVPYVYEQLGALQDALDGYQSAYSAFAEQRDQLESIKQYIGQPAWVEKISPVDLSGFQSQSELPDFQLPIDDDASQHLYLYFASNEFQRIYRDYRELQRLYMVLMTWQQQFPSFEQMIETHVERLDELAPLSQQSIDAAQKFYGYSRIKLEEFQEKLNDIIANDDLFGLANSKQIMQKERLEAIEASLIALQDRDLYRTEWEQFERLKGLLLWDLSAAAINKRWEASKDQVAMNNMLLELEQRIRNVMAARETRLSRFQGFENRMQTLQQQINALKQETAQMLYQQRGMMQTVAAGIIEQQQIHLDQMQAKALLSIARLQDRGYIKERERQNNAAAGIVEPEEESAQGPGGVQINAPEEKPQGAQSLQEVIQGIFSDD